MCRIGYVGQATQKTLTFVAGTYKAMYLKPYTKKLTKDGVGRYRTRRSTPKSTLLLKIPRSEPTLTGIRGYHAIYPSRVRVRAHKNSAFFSYLSVIRQICLAAWQRMNQSLANFLSRGSIPARSFFFVTDCYRHRIYLCVSKCERQRASWSDSGRVRTRS